VRVQFVVSDEGSDFESSCFLHKLKGAGIFGMPTTKMCHFFVVVEHPVKQIQKLIIVQTFKSKSTPFLGKS
jgi:hypothetical protein